MGDGSLRSIATNLSTRQLLRLARRLEVYRDENAYDLINKACLARFLPTLAKESLEKMMEKLGVEKTTQTLNEKIKCTVENNMLTIGNTSAPMFKPESGGKVPETLFYDTPENLTLMEGMLQDYVLGEHILLVGNQGTGKNKLVDRMLNLLNKPREYIQLNRDTTVQTLTLQPTVREGVIVPTDSREAGPNIIHLHPDFRMMVLANRPGFPFLGNDFFGTLGDLFACHVVDNPSMESELAMLRKYGPSVPEDTMRRVVKAFAELRTMADEGQIHYPYSTREVVNIVRHLEQFPNDGLATVVKNVFDFDSYSKEVREALTDVLHKHGNS